jgi:hypothetical protein
MSPLSLLIDHSRLLDRVQTLYSFAPGNQRTIVEERGEVGGSEQGDERTEQVKGLVAGTLVFMPFLLSYVVACASR